MSTYRDKHPTGQPLSFRRPSGPRTVKNALAYVYVTLAAVLAVIPLVWVLCTVISKGSALVLSSSWWLESQRGITPRREGGGAYHAIVGTVEIGLICAVIAVPLGVLGAIFLVEYARGTKVARVGQLHRRHPERHPLDRRGAVHLRALHHHPRLRPLGRRRVAAPWCC